MISNIFFFLSGEKFLQISNEINAHDNVQVDEIYNVEKWNSRYNNIKIRNPRSKMSFQFNDSNSHSASTIFYMQVKYVSIYIVYPWTNDTRFGPLASVVKDLKKGNFFSLFSPTTFWVNWHNWIKETFSSRRAFLH